MLGDMLRQNKVAANVQVHHLVPGLNRIVFSRCTPGSTCVIDKNIHMTHALDGNICQHANICLLGAVCGDPVGINAGSFQFVNSLLQVVGLA